MRAICSRCGSTLYWYAGRGSRLADLRCPDCGGPLSAPKRKKASVPFIWVRARMPVHVRDREVIYEERRVQARWLDGKIQLGRWYSRYVPLNEVESWWRKLLFGACARAGECIYARQGLVHVEHFAFLLEEDYQKIILCLGKGGTNGQEDKGTPEVRH